MLNLIFAIVLIVSILWVAKKFYFPMDMVQHPEKYPVPSGPPVSKKDMGIIMHHLQRWRKEGKLSREEYDHVTDICLTEMRDGPKKD